MECGSRAIFFFLIWMYNVPVPFFLKLSFVPGGPVVKNLPANAGGVSLIPGLGRSLEGGNDNPLQYSCWDNPMDRGAWWATVHGVTKRWTRLSDWALTHPSSIELSLSLIKNQLSVFVCIYIYTLFCSMICLFLHWCYTVLMVALY